MTGVINALGGSQRVSRRRASRQLITNLALWSALGWTALLLVCSLVPGLLSPYDPLAQDLSNTLAQPSSEHLLGTDNVGRDQLSRVIWGAQPAILGILLAMFTATVIGILWGLIAGFFGGVVDMILMRIADVFLAFPGIIFALAVATVFGASLEVTMLAVGLSFAPSIARIMRSGVLSVRQADYVTVTRMYGRSEAHRIFRHVLPNAFTPVLVQLTIFSGIALLAQTGLGFLGIGINPPAPHWGASLAESFRYVAVSPELTLAPGIVVTLTVLSLYQIGDYLRDRFTA